MNDPLEDLLLRQPLIEASASLDQRVHNCFLDRRAQQVRTKRRWLVFAFGALAAGLLVAVCWHWRPSLEGPKPVADALIPPKHGVATIAPAPAAAVQPESMEYNRSLLLDDGVVVLQNNTTVRRLRELSMQHYFWNDPAQNIRIEATMPCEQVVLLREESY